jgi:capsular exopolysaccharide synthesis family protein
MNPSDTQNPAKTAHAAESQLLHSSLLALARTQGEDAPSGPPGLSFTPTLTGLLDALRRRWLLAVGVALGAAALLVVGVFVFNPPRYIAGMRIRVNARQAGAEDVEFPIFKANMEALVKSPLVLSAALNDKTKDGREIKDLAIVRAKGLGAVEWLEKSLKTDYLLGPEVLRVTLPVDHPDETADLLNAIAKAFLNEYTEMERSKKQQRLSELRGKKEELERQLIGLRKDLDDQYKRLDVKDREALGVQQQQLIHKLQAHVTLKIANGEEFNKVESEIVICNARLAKLDTAPIPEEILFEIYSKDANLQGTLKKIAEVEDGIAAAYRDYYEPLASQKAIPLKHEKIKLLAQRSKQEETLKPAIEKRWRERVREDLKHQIEIASEKKVELTRRQDKLMKEIVEMELLLKNGAVANKPPQIVATEEKIELARKALDQTALSYTAVDIEQLASRVTVLTPAAPPSAKDGTQQTKIAGAGGLGVFMMALFGVAFFEFRARRINRPDEVAAGLGLSVVGTLPPMPASSKTPGDKEAAAQEQWLQQLQESADAIRTVLLHKARTSSLRVIMVTSASKGEGKTTVATQLAASLARAWKRVLVIDGDLRHPAVHKLFDTPQEPGLAEVLRGEVESADAVRATALSRMWVLPAGNGDAHALQALAQDNVRTLLEQLKQQYDFIVIDTPPVLPVTDTLLLGQHVDGMLFAILKDISRAPAIYAAQQKLAPLNVPTLGAVVLGADTEFGDKTYGYAMNGAK